ncbi:MAG: hypothetical protein ACAI34_05680, partial [Verrucomicrobium sp.]
MSYFDGGSQRRSLGIAMVEGVWKYRSSYAQVLVPVLVLQAIYLLRATDNRTAAHEERNLIRILRLLEFMLELVSGDPGADLLDSIGIAHGQACRSPGSCLLGSSSLQVWYQRFGGDVEQLKAESGQ